MPQRKDARRNRAESEEAEKSPSPEGPAAGAAPAPDSEATHGRTGEKAAKEEPQSKETGGPKGPEPTRYGDWERKGRCIDF